MPPKAKGVSLTTMLDSGSEDESDTQHQQEMPVSPKDGENIAPVKKARGRQTSRVTKPKVSVKQQTSGGARVIKGEKTAPTKKAGAVARKGARVVLKEQENEEQLASDMEEVEEFEAKHIEHAMSEDELSTPSRLPVVQAKPTRGGKSKSTTEILQVPSKPVVLKRAIPPAAPQEAEIPESEKPVKKIKRGPISTRPSKLIPVTIQAAAARSTEAVGRPATEGQLISNDHLNARLTNEELSFPPTSSNFRTSTTLRPPLSRRVRAPSVSDNESSASDATLRRRLTETTRALSALNLKYNALASLGSTAASQNFDDLKARSDLRHESAEKLISSLRAELITQTALGKHGRSFEKQLKEREAEIVTMKQAEQDMTKEIEQLRNENQTLSVKLAGARGASSTQPIGGKHANNVTATGTGMKESQLKEELYSDLTGLILRSVTRKGEMDVFDCIQTGRNGTLRFHLSVNNPAPQLGASTSKRERYEDAEFVFTPLFDETNDRDLVELLPDYLREEIGFARGNAGKFYGRVVEVLTRARTRDDS